MASPEKKSFVPVDQLMPQITLEQAAAYYGVTLPELHRAATETRTRCFLTCGRTQAIGDRVLAIKADDPVKTWHCHQYGCGKGGNLISLCDLMKPGPNAGGRPRGDRFKSIAADLQSMAQGATRAEAAPASSSTKPPAEEPPKVNVPLTQSENERARLLVDLDRKFVTDPAASAYFRRRPFLTPEVCQKWRVGYLPREVGGEDRSGGTMRGKIVYPYLSAEGEVLTWFGRDPEHEEKRRRWEAAGKVDREPEKFHFVKGFHRGLELFGQHVLREAETPSKIAGLGLLLVEGPNDVLRLDTLGVPAVALCGNAITREQANKLSQFGRQVGGGIVTIFLDCDPEGEAGMKQALGYLAQLISVRLAWTSNMHGGKFKGRQPESLVSAEWEEIQAFLRTGETKDWSLA